MINKPVISDKPSDKLTRLCDSMINHLEQHPENSENIQCSIFMNDGIRAGLVLHNYEDSKAAIVDLFVHIKAIFNANGMQLELITVPNDTSEL